MKHKLTLRKSLEATPCPQCRWHLKPSRSQFAIRPSKPYESRTMPRTFMKNVRKLYVTSLADQDIIFGTDWLRAHNPEVNWSRSQIVFSRCPVSCHLSKYPVSVEPVVPIRKHTTINQLSLILSLISMMILTFLSWPGYFLVPLPLNQKKPPPNIGKTTTSTELAARLALLPLLFKFLPSTACTLKYSANKRPSSPTAPTLGSCH